MDAGSMNGWPLRSDEEGAGDLGVLRMFASGLSLKKEQLEGLPGNSGIVFRNAHQLTFRADFIEKGVRTLIDKLFEGNAIFLMRLRESEAKLMRGGVGGLSKKVALPKEDEANAMPPLVVAEKVPAPMSGKRGMSKRRRVD